MPTISNTVIESMENNTTIIIPMKRYHELIEAEKRLNLLYKARIDNWGGYDYFLDLLGQEDEIS